MYSFFEKQQYKFTYSQKIHYTLRIASAMCFIGHGAFGIITKEIWTNYFGFFGIGHQLSYSLMPVVGMVDIACGIIILFYPLRAVIIWLVVWGFITALLRPLSGEPIAEFFERAGNFGAPLALLLLSGSFDFHLKNIFKRISPTIKMDKKPLASGTWVLSVVVCLLFMGHGWLNIIEKKALIEQYARLGFVNPAFTARFIGIFEMLAGIAVLFRPARHFIFLLFLWKVTSELFYPHHELFEWIERGGSYGAILALWFTLGAYYSLTGNISLRWKAPIFSREKQTTFQFSLGKQKLLN